MKNTTLSKKLIFVSITAILAGQAAPSFASLSTDLQAYYSFDLNGNDSSGNSRNLDTFGGVAFASGLYGQALDLHADASQYAQRTTNDTILDFGSSNFTIQLWVNFNSITSAEQTIFEKASNLGSPGWTISKVTRSGQDGLEFYSGSTVGGMDSPPLSISTGVWHQVIARRDGNTFELFYDNSILVSADSANAIEASPNPLLIGRRTPEDPRGGFPVDGKLDEFAIWTRALTNTEITSLYNGGQGISLATVPIPRAIWLFGSAFVGMNLIGKGRSSRNQA